MTPQWAAVQAVSELYELQVLGRKSDRRHVFCYQFGGNSASGLAMASEGMGGWRCLAVEKLSQVLWAWRGEA